MSQPSWQPPAQQPPPGWQPHPQGYQYPQQAQGWGPQQNNDARRLMEYDARKKGNGVSYLLWFFLGAFGAHRFYLERTSTATAMLIITILSFVTLPVGIGALGLIAIAIWAIVDAFMIPSMVRAYNMRVMHSIQ